MSSFKSFVGIVLLSLLIFQPGHAQDNQSEDCPYSKGRIIEDLGAALEAHKKRLEKGGSPNPLDEFNFCNAELSEANLQGADLVKADLRGAQLVIANLRQADLLGADLLGADLRRADMQWANLQGADLQEANLGGADLQGADLQGANLGGADLLAADLRGADLLGADLRGADLLGADLRGASLLRTDLRGANLQWADLKGAELIRTVLEDAKFSGVDLSEAVYQPINAPAQGYLSGLKGIQSVKFDPGEGSSLVQLRAALKTAGLRELEREATYALESGRTHHMLARWNAAWDDNSNGGASNRDSMAAAIEGALRLVFFEWTVNYGMSYGRPILILLALIGVFTLVYLPAIMMTRKQPDDSGIFRIWPEGRIKRSGKNFEAADDVIVEPLEAHGIAAFGLAFYFSVISAFHVGWRDLNVGTWIARIQPREYALRANGWVRVFSGVQSLISVYLIALWTITYFGRPFG